MPRMRKILVSEEDLPQATSWAQWRIQQELPESLRIRANGKCFDCGEPLQAGPCGGWHSRTENFSRSSSAFITFCCSCRGCNGK